MMSNEQAHTLEILELQAMLARASSAISALSLKARATLAASSSDQVQVDIGTYEIRAGNVSGRVIAELYVERDPNDPNIKTEHWGLYPTLGWVTPSAAEPTPPALQFYRIPSGYASAADFRKMLRAKPSVTYVQAQCVTQPP
jgi:hypothetical protein